jgi:hypothetical protein
VTRDGFEDLVGSDPKCTGVVRGAAEEPETQLWRITIPVIATVGGSLSKAEQRRLHEEIDSTNDPD